MNTMALPKAAIIANTTQLESFSQPRCKVGNNGRSLASRKRSFPQVLHQMLDVVEESGQDSIVSWQPHGRAFRVHNPKRFVLEIMQTMFRQTKWPSFQRQLNLYGFTRISSGKDKGAYYHPNFLRGRYELCERIAIVRQKGNRFRIKADPDLDPDFYSEPYMERSPRESAKDETSTPKRRAKRRFNVLENKAPLSPSFSLGSDIDIEEDSSFLRKMSYTDLVDLHSMLPQDSPSEASSSMEENDLYASLESASLLLEDIGCLSDDEENESLPQEVRRPAKEIRRPPPELEEPTIPTTLPDDPTKLQELFNMLGKPFRLDDLDLLPEDDIGWKHLLHSP